MSRPVIEAACEKCGQRTGIYVDQQGRVLHWTCRKRARGAEPPKYRAVEDVEVAGAHR